MHEDTCIDMHIHCSIVYSKTCDTKGTYLWCKTDSYTTTIQLKYY